MVKNKLPILKTTKESSTCKNFLQIQKEEENEKI